MAETKTKAKTPRKTLSLSKGKTKTSKSPKSPKTTKTPKTPKEPRKTLSLSKGKVKVADYIYSVGRRKRAIARIRLFTKTKQDKKASLIVNDKPIDEYFRLKEAKSLYLEPLRITNTVDRFYATIKVIGSGPQGQIGAIIHGISRALVKADEGFRPVLKKRGFLKRDPRKKQKRMIGTGGKARRKKQSPKR